MTDRVAHSEWLSEAFKQCCAENPNGYGYNCENDSYDDISRHLEDKDHDGYHDDFGDDVDTASQDFGCKTFGLFGALSEDISVPTTLLGMIFVLGVGWMILLRKFAKTMVSVTEAFKIFAMCWIGVKSESPFYFVFAAAYTLIIIVKRDKLKFAAKMISHSALAMQKNPSIMGALFILKLAYLIQSVVTIMALVKVPSVLAMDMDCVAKEPSWLRWALEIILFSWLWSICFYDQIRLSVISLIVGSWHWHPENKPSLFQAFQTTTTKSLGTNALSALVIAIVMRIKQAAKFKCWMIFSPPHFVLFLICWCLYTMIKMLTKFSLIIHNFTGLSFFKSAGRCYKIMTRHFENGMVTEASSQNVLYLSCFVFSFVVTISAWAWYDEVFSEPLENISTFTESGIPAEALILMIGFFLYYPVWTIFWLIFMEIFINNERDEGDLSETCTGIYPVELIPILCALFVGSIAMLLFTFLGHAIMDTINVCFVCFAVDKDNGVDMTNNLFANELVKEVPGLIMSLTDPAANKVSAGAMQQQIQMVSMPPMAGQPMVGQPLVGQPLVGQPMVGQPMVGQPMVGQPMVGQPMVGQPMVGQPMVGQPMVGQPMVGQPMVGQPMQTIDA